MASTEQAAAIDRKLKAGGSNEDAPEKKMTKTEEITPGWAMMLMSKIGDVET